MITQAGQKPSALLGLHVFALESCNMLIFTDDEKERIRASKIEKNRREKRKEEKKNHFFFLS